MAEAKAASCVADAAPQALSCCISGLKAEQLFLFRVEFLLGDRAYIQQLLKLFQFVRGGVLLLYRNGLPLLNLSIHAGR